MPKVDLITTTFRNVDKLKICLTSITEKTKFVDYKWYVYANDPNDEVKQIIHNSMFVDDILFNDRIIPIFNDSNDGTFSTNNNDAAEEGDSEYILFMNDDVEPINDDWLFHMVNIMDSDAKVGAVGAMLLYPNKLIQHIGVMFDHRTNGLPFHIFYKQQLSEFAMHSRLYQAVTGACMLVRRKDFEGMGGFETAYKYGYEDTSFCLKLKHDLGKNSVYCAESRLIHHEGISGKFKNHPYLQENIKTFKTQWKKKIFNDHQFYLNNSDYMLYKRKSV